MTIATQGILTSRNERWQLPLSLRLALRELRGGLRGFYIFLFCVALGVTAITAIRSLSETLKQGVVKEGQTILGGDMELALNHRRATRKERSFLQSKGQISEIATIRAMARTQNTGKTTLIALKSVDANFPLFGKVELSGGEEIQALLSTPGNVVVDALLLNRLQVKVGDTIRLGSGTVTIADIIDKDPDRLSAPPSLGPTVITSVKTLKKVELAHPGSLVRWAYRIRFADGADAEGNLKKIRQDIKTTYVQSGFSVRDRKDPAPIIRRAIDQMAQYLTFVGLTALIVGGVGVANGVSTYLQRKRKVIAAFKCLGASSGLITRIYLIQVILVACLGILIGLCLGTLLPLVAAPLVSNFVPFDSPALFQPKALILAAFYGLLVALLFTLWPLGRARLVKPQVLVRQIVSDERVRPPRRFLFASAVILLALAAITIWASANPWVAIYFCASLGILFFVFAGLGYVLQTAFAHIPRPTHTETAIALSNLAAPGSLTRSITLSLGTGLSLLVAVALIDRSMVAELKTGLPQDAPNYFFLDISKAQLSDFQAHVKKAAPEGQLNQAPMLRGRIVSLAGQSAETIDAPPSVAWALRGDRGLTYAEKLPEGSKITKGEWWPKDYTGEPLVSFEQEIADGLGLKIGDEVTVNVLGRNVSAKIANTRTLKWESLAINFVMIFSPNTLSGAPFNILATLHTTDDPEEREKGKFVDALADRFPNITVIRVRDTIDAVNDIFAKLMLAIRGAGALTLLAGSLVLAGALATAQQTRIYQSVILKTLGATRRRIILTHIIEYTLLAIATSLFAAALGTAAAWITVTQMMDLEFTLNISAIIQAVLVALILVLVFGIAGSWRSLSAKISPELRKSAS